MLCLRGSAPDTVVGLTAPPRPICETLGHTLAGGPTELRAPGPRDPTVRHCMDVLRSERHHIFGLHLNKVSLSPFDSKRWIAENGVDTLAYGYAADMDAYIDELTGGD